MFSVNLGQQIACFAEGIASSLFEAHDVIGAEQQINAEAEPEGDVGLTAGGGDTFVVGSCGTNNALGCARDYRMRRLARDSEAGG